MKIINSAISFINRHVPFSNNRELEKEAKLIINGTQKTKAQLAEIDRHIEALWQRIAKDLGQDNKHDDGG